MTTKRKFDVMVGLLPRVLIRNLLIADYQARADCEAKRQRPVCKSVIEMRNGIKRITRDQWPPSKTIELFPKQRNRTHGRVQHRRAHVSA
jgi:hypothetical protein